MALALKLAALRALEAGAKEVWAGNATNASMLTLNDCLGFRPRPAFSEFGWGRVPA